MINVIGSIFLLMAAAGSGQDQDLILEVYDVEELVQENIGVYSALDDTELGKEKADGTRNLARIIRTFVTPPLRENREDVKAIGASTIVARVELEQHKWVKAFLESQRLMKGVYLLIEMKFLSLSPEAYKSWNPDEKQVKLVSSGEAEALLAKWRSNEMVLHRPSFLLANRQQVRLSLMSQTAYIKEYQVHESVEPLGTRIVVPVIEKAKEGITFDGTAVLLENDYVAFDFHAEETSIERPMATKQKKHGLVAVPVVRSSSVSSKLRLKIDEVAIFSAPRHDGRYLVIFITVRKVLAEELPALELDREEK